MSARSGLAVGQFPDPLTHDPRVLRFPLTLLVFLLLLGAGSRFALAAGGGREPATNLDRLGQAAAALADSVAAGMPLAGGDTLCLEVPRHPAAWLLESALLARIDAAGGTAVACETLPPGRRRLTVAIDQLSTAYLPIDDDDLVERRAHLRLLAVGQRDGRYLRSSYELTLADTVARLDTSLIEAGGYDWSDATLPPEAAGFWGRVVEPAVVGAAAAIVVVLLFAVRSR